MKTRWLIKKDLEWLKAHLEIMLADVEYEHKRFFTEYSKGKAKDILLKIGRRLNE